MTPQDIAAIGDVYRSLTPPAHAGTKSLDDRVRTPARIEGMKTLIAALQVRDMIIDDVCELLQFSPSGARKYIRDLQDGFVLEVYAAGAEHKRTYRLVDDEAAVQAFIERLAMGRTLARAAARSPIARAQRDTTRHFHLMRDDAYFAVKVQQEAVYCDPRALPRNFFRAEAAHGEPLQRVPVVPVKRSGFPSPADIRFDLGVPA